jgi:2,5-furandicarboxylate decarboxylase 1
MQTPIPPKITNGYRSAKEIIKYGKDINLYDFPTMLTSGKDGGRYFASGIAVIKDPDTGIRNLSVHR